MCLFDFRLCREISFQFRTRLPHGLLVYHSVKDRPEGLDPYALYVIVEKGQLKVVHVFGKHSTSITVGEGIEIFHYLPNPYEVVSFAISMNHIS
jgi:hypothetical protein